MGYFGHVMRFFIFSYSFDIDLNFAITFTTIHPWPATSSPFQIDSILLLLTLYLWCQNVCIIFLFYHTFSCFNRDVGATIWLYFIDAEGVVYRRFAYFCLNFNNILRFLSPLLSNNLITSTTSPSSYILFRLQILNFNNLLLLSSFNMNLIIFTIITCIFTCLAFFMSSCAFF